LQSVGVTEQHTCDKITVIVKVRFARQDETVSLRPKFVSLAFDSWQEMMQYTT